MYNSEWHSSVAHWPRKLEPEPAYRATQSKSHRSWSPIVSAIDPSRDLTSFLAWVAVHVTGSKSEFSFAAYRVAPVAPFPMWPWRPLYIWWCLARRCVLSISSVCFLHTLWCLQRGKISRPTASFHPGLILCLFKVGTCEREGALVRQCQKVGRNRAA